MTSIRPAWDQVLSCPTLPSLPGVGLEVLALTRDPNVNVEQLAKAVERDPALSAKVLKTVNSSLFGLSQPCTTIRRALGFLGMGAVKSLVLGFSLMDSTRNVQGAPGLDMDGYWRRAILSASGARVIAQATKACDPEEAFTASLFQDLGVLAMVTALGEAYTGAVAPASNDHGLHSELELRTFGFTHSELGAALATKWRLPDRYVQVIRLHHSPELAEPAIQGLVRSVALGTSVALAAAASQHGASQAVADLLVRANIWFGTGASDLEAMLDKVSMSAVEVSKLFEKDLGTPANLRELLQQAGEEQMLQNMAAMREAEDLRSRNEHLVKQAYTDGLTGLANRKRFDEEAGRLLAEGRSFGRTVALIMIDGDKFKSVNDTYGHAVGDEVLKELSARIAAATGDKGVACRYGGEEFAVLAPGLSRNEAHQLAEAIRRRIADSIFSFPGVEKAPSTLPVTASFGVAVNDPGAKELLTSVGSLISAADGALYQAKHAGRNRVCVHTPDVVTEEKPAAPVPAPASTLPSTPASTPARDAVAAAAPVRVANAPLRQGPATASASSAAAAPAPGAPPAHRATKPATGATTTGTPTRVLLIEDDALSAKLLMTLLQKSPGSSGGGVLVEWIRDGNVALRRICDVAMTQNTPGEIAVDKRPHVIVLDLAMPGVDGLTLVRAARAIPTLKKTPLIVLSATSDAHTSRKCLDAGATVFVTKTDLANDLTRWINLITVQYPAGQVDSASVNTSLHTAQAA